MKIRFCENNKGTNKVYRKLKENHPEWDIKRKDCVKRCDVCRKAPFAKVEGEIVQADDGDELYQKLETSPAGA